MILEIYVLNFDKAVHQPIEPGMENVSYAQAAGSIMHAMRSAVGVVSTYQSNPRKAH